MPAAPRPREQVSLETSPHLPGVEFLTVKNSQRLWRTYHETYAICVVPEASNDRSTFSTWRYRMKTRTIGPAAAMLIEPGEVHTTLKCSSNANFFVILLRPEFIAGVSHELGLPPRPHFRTGQTESARLVREFERLLQSSRGPDSLEQQAQLGETLRLPFEQAGERRPGPLPTGVHPAVTRARDYLQDNLAQPISLDELARAAGLSKYHLSRCFADRYGVPPHQYLNQLRAATVRDELRKGKTVADIEVGFADQSHLIRHFRSVFGVTPGQFSAGLGGTKRFST